MIGTGDGRGTAPAVFFYDLGDPACYLMAEQLASAIAAVPEWEPVIGTALGIRRPAPDLDELARRAEALGLLPLRWPRNWPPDTSLVTRAATYAKHAGRVVAFSLAAFRQAFAGGRNLADQDTVLIAAAACEMHPSAVLRGVGLRSVSTGLERASLRATAAGVKRLPAVEVAGQIHCGHDAALEAVRALAGTTR